MTLSIVIHFSPIRITYGALWWVVLIVRSAQQISKLMLPFQYSLMADVTAKMNEILFARTGTPAPAELGNQTIFLLE